MKYWKDILDAIPVEEAKLDENLQITGIASDSRKVEEGYLFIAVKGAQVDGHDYIEKAIENGAVAVIGTDSELLSKLNIVYATTKEKKQYLGKLAAYFYDYPSTEFKLIGITGTNGKTTTASLLHDLYFDLGYKIGLISTIHIKIGNETRPTAYTTPDAIHLQSVFRDCANEGCSHVFMEVSSHAIAQGRIAESDFDLAIFTNITHDHLDYHGTFKEYINAKKMFFDQLSSNATALINKDDKNGTVMVQNTAATVKTFGLKRMADYKCKILSNDMIGLHLQINGLESFFKLSGEFNAYNLTAAFGAAYELGEDTDEILRAMSGLNAASGRLERVDVEGIDYSVFVDYAHTPDALKNVLLALSQMRKHQSKIITVVGCGGNRDKLKRPKMASIAAANSDLLIMTSDNPRNEDPEEILNDMESGVDENKTSKVLRIADRKMAIKTACMMASKDDLVLVAGKGHETYQEIKGEKLPFDDKEIVKATLLKI